MSNNAQSVLEMIFRTKKEGNGEKETKDGMGSVKDIFEKTTGISLTMAGAITAAGAALGYLVSRASESEQAGVRLNAVLTATEGQSGMTMESLDRLARQVSNLTGIDDENVMSAESILLTYQSIGANIFPQVITAATDLSAVFGMDLTSAATMLGKALQSPTTGLAALRRVGVIFTEEQQTTIQRLVDENQLFEAQSLILDALNQKIGGTAAALGQTLAGQWNRLTTAMENAAENGGIPFVEILEELLGGITSWIEITFRASDAAAQHSDEILQTSSSYAEYEAELRRSVEGLNFVIDSEGDLYEQIWTNNGVILQLRDSNFLLSESEYEVARATNANQQSQADLELAYQNLRTIIAGSFGAENDRYRDQLTELRDRATELRGQIETLAATPNRTQEQDDQLEDWNQDLIDIQTQIGDLALAHEEAMHRMAFNMIMEQAASDGLTQNEMTNLTTLGVAWGLFDEDTARVIESVNGNIGDLDATELENFETTISNILGLPTYREFTFVTRFETYGNQGGGARFATADDYQNLYGVTGYAEGVNDFIVPPGYPNDSYLVGLTSGEKLDVTPPGGSSPSSSGSQPIMINIYLDGRLISQQLADQLGLQGIG